MATLGDKYATQSITVVAGTPQTFDGGGYSIVYPATIKVIPGVGGTMLVEYRIAAGTNWEMWPAGTVSSFTTAILDVPIDSLRFTATAANGVVEISQ